VLIDGVERKPRVIVIDDSRAMRTILRKNLMEVGCEVIAEAVHGADGLARLRELGAADLALVDWNMPEMNGFEFLCAVRGDHAFNSMRVVMVTSETELDQMTRALSAGANEYLMKPFTQDALREKLAILGLATH
jgi:two-component system chemotaxis response regulator CheY